jgi:hypothetical protein
MSTTAPLIRANCKPAGATREIFPTNRGYMSLDAAVTVDLSQPKKDILRGPVWDGTALASQELTQHEYHG